MMLCFNKKKAWFLMKFSLSHQNKQAKRKQRIITCFLSNYWHRHWGSDGSGWGLHGRWFDYFHFCKKMFIALMYRLSLPKTHLPICLPWWILKSNKLVFKEQYILIIITSIYKIITYLKICDIILKYNSII